MTDLLVVIVMLVVLSMLLVPALAGPQNKAGRMQCANNLRQIGVASMVYASEYRGWLPVCTIGAANSGGKVNNLGGLHYTRYLVGAYTANTKVPTNAVSTTFDCLGFLYHAALVGNGQNLFCPDTWGTSLGANNYSPLITTDAGGIARGSYAFNPRLVDATNGIIARRYQKTRDLQPHKLLAVDYFGTASLDGNAYEHYREGGLNVLFSDGSVQFSRDAVLTTLLSNFVVNESITSNDQANQIMDYLEMDH
jgi:prepilin-type processing-associated H-X9-DG protein